MTKLMVITICVLLFTVIHLKNQIDSLQAGLELSGQAVQFYHSGMMQCEHSKVHM